jgi:hypothetical protein
MKLFLLSVVSVLFFKMSNAQEQVNALPAGKYETVIKNQQNKWERGDIILLDQNKYKISSSDETGEYRFSVTAQRVFFTSGPLKSIYAKTSLNNQTPVIVLPVAENEQLGLKLPSEIRGYLKQ